MPDRQVKLADCTYLYTIEVSVSEVKSLELVLPLGQAACDVSLGLLGLAVDSIEVLLELHSPPDISRLSICHLAALFVKGAGPY